MRNIFYSLAGIILLLGITACSEEERYTTSVVKDIELFLDDEDFLTAELEELIGHLTDYRNALRAKDTQRLHDLLKEGRELKATAGGN